MAIRLSFVVPAYNEQALLGACLAAIRAEIARSGAEAEIIVVDNASTDHTALVARSFAGVRLVQEPVKGLVRARRAGFLASRGELVANIDADTVLPPGWLDRVEAAFVADPALVALSGPYIYADLPRWQQAMTMAFYRVGYLCYLANRFLLRTGSMIQGGNFVVRRQAVLAIGGFNLDFSFYGEDTDLARRLSRVGKVRFTFGLRAVSSGRRFRGEGLLRVGWRYSVNYLWATYRHRPYSEGWQDYRQEPGEGSSGQR